MTYELIVNTLPIAKARPKFSKWGAYTPAKTANYEKLIRLAWQDKYRRVEPLNGALHVDIKFYMPIPKNLSKKAKERLLGAPHNKRPDIDNLAKAVLDGLNGIAFVDDNLVSDIILSKIYAEEPKVEIIIKEIDYEKS